LETFYPVGADLTYEFDFLGGVRRSIESANAPLQAVERSDRDLMV
jgi:hypothetical protein